MEVLVIIAIVALIIWLVTQIPAGPPWFGWLNRVALAVWAVCITFLAAGLRISS